MTAGTPAPQDAETVDEVEVVARAMYLGQARHHVHPDDTETPEEKWGDHPFKATWFDGAREALAALAPVRAREVEAARRDGARKALEQAAERADHTEPGLLVEPGPWLRDLAATPADDEQHDTKEDDR